MRTIQEAAKQAVSGEDETLWQALTGIATEVEQYIMYNEDNPAVVKLCESILRGMSLAERSLYGIGET